MVYIITKKYMLDYQIEDTTIWKVYNDSNKALEELQRLKNDWLEERDLSQYRIEEDDTYFYVNDGYESFEYAIETHKIMGE